MFCFHERITGARGTIQVAFTDREGGHSTGSMGSLNLGRTDVDELVAVRANGELVRRALGAELLVATHQVHGREVLVADESFLSGWGRDSWLGEAAGGPPLPQADAIVTDRPGIALVVRVADCVPVLLADATGGVLGVAHAGRAGVDLGVLEATVTAMRRLGAGRIEAVVGPHVCAGCYEVPPQMAEQLETRHPGIRATTRWGSDSLDLGGACGRQLEALGVGWRSVGGCTMTTPVLHSHRRDGGGAGRLAGLVCRVS